MMLTMIQHRRGSEERVLKSIADPADEVEEGEFDLLEEHPGQGVGRDLLHQRRKPPDVETAGS